jgi:hypothetical protein
VKQEYFMCLNLPISENERKFDHARLRRLVALDTVLSCCQRHVAQCPLKCNR